MFRRFFVWLSKGPDPVEQYGTRAVFGLSNDIDDTQWSAAVTSPPGDIISLSICSAPDAPIGHYTVTLDSRIQFNLILLFNPWCPRKWKDISISVDFIMLLYKHITKSAVSFDTQSAGQT